jgi:hypothetical protein
MLKEAYKNLLQSKSIGKIDKHEPLQNKGNKRMSKQGVSRKTRKSIPHSCTSRSSCITSFFLDLVFGSAISWGTSEPHANPTQSSTYKPYSRKLRLIEKPLVR